jgi:hypothetical protein
VRHVGAKTSLFVYPPDRNDGHQYVTHGKSRCPMHELGPSLSERGLYDGHAEYTFGWGVIRDGIIRHPRCIH